MKMSPDYQERYHSTSQTCGCPARKYHPEKPCKHMEQEQHNLNAEQLREECKVHMTTLYQPFTKRPYCGCWDWLEMGFDTCPHIEFKLKEFRLADETARRWVEAAAKNPVAIARMEVQ